MWLTLSSLAAAFTFADMGIGNGVLNQISRLFGEDDERGMIGVISSGYAILSLICLAILAAFAIAYPFVPWFKVFNVQTDLARAESGPAVMAFILCFALAIPTGLVQKVQAGLQRGFAASLWQCLSSLLSLGGVILAITFQQGIFWLVLAYMGPPILVAVLNSVHFFGSVHASIAPRTSAISIPAIKRISHSGGLFFVLQIVAAVSYTSDALVIAQVLGAAAVAQYAVPEKLFSLISMVLVIMLTPLWPAYGEAIARRDHKWAQEALNKSLRLAFVFSLAAVLVLTPLAPTVLRFWVRGAIDPPWLLLIGLAVWKVIEGQGNAISMFFNGANEVRYLLINSCLTSIAALALKIVLAKYWGVAGTVWATIIAFSTFMLIPSYIHINAYFRRSRPADSTPLMR